MYSICYNISYNNDFCFTLDKFYSCNSVFTFRVVVLSDDDLVGCWRKRWQIILGWWRPWGWGWLVWRVGHFSVHDHIFLII